MNPKVENSRSSSVSSFFDQTDKYCKSEHYLNVRAEIVKELCGEMEGTSILDVGCGNGVMSKQFLSMGIKHITLLDISKNMLKLARRNFEEGSGGNDKMTFVLGDADDISPNASFDVILALGLLAYVADPKALLSKLARMLNPGGRLLVQFTDCGTPLGALLWKYDSIVELFFKGRGYQLNNMKLRQVESAVSGMGLVPVKKVRHSFYLPGMQRFLPGWLLYKFEAAVWKGKLLSKLGSDYVVMFQKKYSPHLARRNKGVPLVSVLMSVYNGARYVHDAVSSILNQEHEDFELLVIDDGSVDETPDILAAFSDPRIRVFTEGNRGLTRSLNNGLRLAKGEYVARLDADDISRVDRLEKQVAYLDGHPEVALVGTGVTVVTEDDRVLRDYIYPSEHNLLAAELGRLVSPLPHSTIMFRRKEVLDCGGYRDIFSKAQDYDLYLRLVEKHRVASIQEPLCRLRHSMRSMTFEDGEGQQFQYAVLALITSVIRREQGIDPLDTPARPEFLEKFQAWYASSSYPRRFRSRELRRQARLVWSQGCAMEAFRCLVSAMIADRSWITERLGMRRIGSEASDAMRWVRNLRNKAS